MIELTHVSKDFGKGQQEVHAVRDVSLSIDKGEIFGIIGFLSCDALRLGSTWVLMLMLMLCIAIIVLDLIGLLSFRGK